MATQAMPVSCHSGDSSYATFQDWARSVGRASSETLRRRLALFETEHMIVAYDQAKRASTTVARNAASV